MIKRMLVILCTVIFAASPFIPFFAAYGSEGQTVAKDIALRDTFELGYYPQSRVTDSGILAELNAIETEMTDYGFKQLPLTENRKLDMSFADVEYNGETMSLTALAKLLTGKKYSIAGPKFFKYNGEWLNDIRHKLGV